MKHFYLLLLVIFFSVQIQAQNAPFITTWEVSGWDLDINIPVVSMNNNTYNVDFGDGTTRINQSGFATHTYSQPGIYTVSITANFLRINLALSMSSHKILTVEQWGDSVWTSMERAFQGCSNLVINALDAPDLSQVLSMQWMFKDATSINQPINHWDVSNVTNMAELFRNATSFNQPLSNWDVSNVTNMWHMFNNATSFNQPINNWDVSNVSYMSGMFEGASSFNQPLNNWDVSNVLGMIAMFQNAISFNQPIDNWDVGNVTGIFHMFFNATSFNQPLNNWDVSNVTNASAMFRSATSFNQPLNNWDVSNLINMRGMFDGATSFNQNLSDWNFHNNVDLGIFTPGFLSFCGMDSQNYEALLFKFAVLGLGNKVLGAQGVEYCNSAVRDYLDNNLAWNILDGGLSSDCNFITGEILYDQNNTGCDPNDIAVEGFMIHVTDGINDYSTLSTNGTYNFSVFGPSFTVSVVNTPSFFTVNPASANVTFSGSNTEVMDFCVTANQPVEDLNITLLPPSEARPGFEAEYRLVVRNIGTETISNVEATLEFDDLMQQFIIASLSPTTTTANTLTYSIGSLQPFQTVEINVTMLTFPPPTVNGDDVLNFTATVMPVANDHTPHDNTFNLEQIVVNSFDPNDKQVLQGEELLIDDIGEYLDYLIRFQNTGTASAINVRILDTLHPKLDWSTLTPISASHDYYVNITNGNRVEFMFDNIHLPDSLSNEPASHGFVAYKIKPKSNVQPGDVISGDAAIYFDFNAPIITNMVHTQIVDPLSIEEVFNPLRRVILYPNPTSNTLHIHLTDGIELQEVLIYDLQGKEVQMIQGKETTLDVENLRPGMYLLKITTDRGTINRQLIKN